MFSLSVMRSTFCFSNGETLAVPTTSLLHNFWHLGTVDPIFVGNKRLDAMSALENNPKVNAVTKMKTMKTMKTNQMAELKQ